MRTRFAVLVAALALSATAIPGVGASGRAPDEKAIATSVRWLHLEANLLVDTPESLLPTISAAHDAGANGVFVSDSKMELWFTLPRPDRALWLQRMRGLRDEIHALGMTMIVNSDSLGYCTGLLSHDVNLAAGIPVRRAPMVVRGRRLVPQETASVRNGSFETHRGNRPVGWDYQDRTGQATVVDTAVVHSGRASLRLQPTAGGMARISGSFRARPFQQYRLTFWVRATGLTAGWLAPYVVNGDQTRRLTDQQFSIGGRDGSYFASATNRSFGWRRMSLAFNSQASRRVRFTLGAWDFTAGRMWLDDVSVSADPTLNLIRRSDLPVTVTAPGGRRLQEGRDFARVRDPRLGHIEWPGGYDTYHRAPRVRLRPGAGLRQGDVVRFSGQTATVTAAGQVACSWNHPALLALVRRVHRLAATEIQPDGIFINIDEVRSGGWDPADLAYGSSATALAAHLNKVLTGLRQVAPGLPVYMWCDMFDPTLNAVANYYQVRGSLAGSWRTLDPSSVVMVNWKSGEYLLGPAARSIEHFAGLGFKQVLAGFYDEPVAANHANWVSAAGDTPGIQGSMYTTWERDYSQVTAFGSLWW